MAFIDDGKYQWQDVFNELRNYIEKSTFNKKDDFNGIYNDIKLMKDFIYDVIHNKLFKNKDLDENEQNIRALCKYVISKLLPFITKCINLIDTKLKRESNMDLALLLKSYYELEDDLYSIASFRSLTHFAHYMERQDDKSQLVWKYNMEDTMGGIFYYSNQMILDHKYKNLIKQCPTGFGKSKSDCVIISFCFGYDVNDDILKIVGNKDLVKPITESIVKMLKSSKFGKVFPQFGKYKGSTEMFKNCALTDGTFTLTDSKKSLSFSCRNKETAIDGGRFNKQFYDDVTQSNDRENVQAHLKDRGKYNSQWKKRQYDEFSCLRWFTGTAYHREDFLSYIRKYYSNNKELQRELSTRGKRWNKFVKVNNTQDTIYISVPKLADLELGEDKCYCTFPQKYSKSEALKELHGSLTERRRFMAMEQQEPLPPESLAFDWTYLRQYDKLPDKIKENDCETIVIIDPNRRGKDNYAGLIFKRPNDDDDPHWYFVDCFYKKVSSKVALPKICERASYHKAHKMAFETNTVDSYQMKKEIKTLLASYSWKECKIEDFYSTLNKEEKISKYSDDIRDYIIFPRRGMYYEDSDMGRAMSDIVNYSFEGKNGNDDSIDCCAMLMINVLKTNKNTIETLDIRL